MRTEHQDLKELSPDEISEVLDQESIGHLACQAGGELYVVPVTYVHEGNTIYSHSRPGKKLEMMRKHSRVCLQVEQVRGSFSWRSAIVWGKFEVLKGLEAATAMRLLTVRISEMESERKPAPIELEIEAILNRSVIYAIRIEKATGRSEGFTPAKTLVKEK
jgi:hypothetical protein